MRLTCPKCDAEYEIPDRVIPRKGRDVQCSNCDKIWFFTHPDYVELDADPDPTPDPDPAPDPDPVPAAEPSAPPRRKLDPAVAEILRAEAEHEARLRSGETSDPTQGSLDPAQSARAARARVAQLRGDQGAQAKALPDIEEISSTLRASDSSELEYPVWKPHQHKGGFSRGFLLVVILAALLAVIYFNARSIGETVPQAATYVKVYVAKVDAARVWLAGLFNGTPPD